MFSILKDDLMVRNLNAEILFVRVKDFLCCFVADKLDLNAVQLSRHLNRMSLFNSMEL